MLHGVQDGIERWGISRGILYITSNDAIREDLNELHIPQEAVSSTTIADLLTVSAEAGVADASVAAEDAAQEKPLASDAQSPLALACDRTLGYSAVLHLPVSCL